MSDQYEFGYWGGIRGIAFPARALAAYLKLNLNVVNYGE